ncbi:hypothetical protein D3C78_1235030 [compost metagenome]
MVIGIAPFAGAHATPISGPSLVSATRMQSTGRLRISAERLGAYMARVTKHVVSLSGTCSLLWWISASANIDSREGSLSTAFSDCFGATLSFLIGAVCVMGLRHSSWSGVSRAGLMISVTVLSRILATCHGSENRALSNSTAESKTAGVTWVTQGFSLASINACSIAWSAYRCRLNSLRRRRRITSLNAALANSRKLESNGI